jgi:ribulose-phosphate 3-epimerase
MTAIIPAILTKSIDDFEQKMSALEGLTDWVQVDIMDGIFVPNTSLAIESAEPYRESFSIEAHLMVSNPLDYVKRCQQTGVKRVIFHIESTEDSAEVLRTITRMGMEGGIALNPETDASLIASISSLTKNVVLLGVHPGFQGQFFIVDTIQKIRRVKELFPMITVSVDGGVNKDTIASIASAGATNVIVGSALFETADIKNTFEHLYTLANPT